MLLAHKKNLLDPDKHAGLFQALIISMLCHLVKLPYFLLSFFEFFQACHVLFFYNFFLLLHLLYILEREQQGKLRDTNPFNS